MMTPGASADLTHTVSAADTALAVGSGDLPVLATPRLLAWAEGATCAAVAGLVGEGQSTVGVRVELQHLVASAVGRVVRVEARLAEVDGRRLRFEVTATHAGAPADGGEIVGRGIVERVLVDADRFLSRLA